MRTRILLTVFLLMLALTGLLLFTRPVFAPEAYQKQGSDPIELVFAPNTQRPLVITRAGSLLEPAADRWQAVTVDAVINDVYVDSDGTLYAGTSDGLLRRRDGVWERIENIPPTRQLEAMHGFLFAFGDQGAARTTQGENVDNEWRLLELPVPEKSARELVMLADHSHVVLNDDLQQTDDMGLSWTRMASPEGVRLIAADPQARLLAFTTSGMARWIEGDRWEEVVTLPNRVIPEKVLIFNDQLLVLADGDLLRLDGNRWQIVLVTENTYFTAATVHQGQVLWAADAHNRTFWTSEDGTNWESVAME